MLKRNLALCISLALLLSGCGNVNQNNINKTVSDNKNIIDTTYNKNITEKPKSDSTLESTSALSSAPKSNSDTTIESTPTSESFNPLVTSDTSSLRTMAIPWSWLYSSRDNANLLAEYKGYGFGDTSKKIFTLPLMKAMKMVILLAF